MSRPRWFGAATAIVAVLVGLALALTHPANAFAIGSTRFSNDPQKLFSEVKITGQGQGIVLPAGVGSLAPASFNPLRGYPEAIPVGSTSFNKDMFVGTLQIADPQTGRTGVAYCIDLRYKAQIGVDYHSGMWNEAQVPHMGYVQYILTHYYPTVSDQPDAVPDDSYRAAAVQAAIWFFTDGYVLGQENNSDLRSLTGQIVRDAIAHGPSAEPPLPQVRVTPSNIGVPAAGQIAGPYTVDADGPSTISSHGVEIFTDRQGTHPLEDGDAVEPGTQLWARSASDVNSAGFVLNRVVMEPVGTVYLYDHADAGVSQAQKLVLAQNTQLVSRSGANVGVSPIAPVAPITAPVTPVTPVTPITPVTPVTPIAPVTPITPVAGTGRLSITKVIRGMGAGRQGIVRIVVIGPGLRRELAIRPGASAGGYTRLLTGLPAGATYAISETSDGSNYRARLAGMPVINPSFVRIIPGQTRYVTIIDTYGSPIRPRPRPVLPGVPVTG